MQAGQPTAAGWLPSSRFGGPMTTAAITGHWAFRGPSDRCTARAGHSAELSHRTTKVGGEVKGSSHRLRTRGAGPKRPFTSTARRADL